MENAIRLQVLKECDKLIARHNLRVRQQKKNQTRYRKRSGEEPILPSNYEPEHWLLHPHFSPFHVRARADAIAHSIADKIRNRVYQPHPALTLQIPKPTGGTRGITIFPVADAAVSNYLFRTLRNRNQQFFSSYAYAYRGDRNAHNAVEHLARYVNGTNRVYVLNYDFSKYFDSIDHNYLDHVLRKHFRVSEKEHHALQGFLKYQKADGRQAYESTIFTQNDRGVPQGSSISLFLANVACLELDLEIEREGAIFARYADDTIILCNTYDMAHRCANRMMAHGNRSHTQINFEKSDGISVLSLEPHAEMRSISYFDFLGNRISQKSITIANRSVKRIKRKISAIIHRHLILYPSRGTFSLTRVTNTGIDWDMVTCINEIRRYLYGQITEQQLAAANETTDGPLFMTKGLLSYYPLIDDPSIFYELDGWLLNVLKRAQQKRKLLIIANCPGYQLYSEQELKSGSWYNGEIPNETRLPSFYKSWFYVRKLLKVFGASFFPAPDYES